MAEEGVELEVLEHEFSEESRLCNFPVVIRGQKIWCSRELLAKHSPVFEKMFFGEFKEGQKDVTEVELPDKEVADFVQLLHVLINMKPISGKSELMVYR